MKGVKRYKLNGETDIENRLVDMGRGEGRVLLFFMERVTWNLISPYVK